MRLNPESPFISRAHSRLDANDSATFLDGVSAWNDKSGNNNHAFQTTTTNQPVYIANEIQFDGSDDGLSLTNEINRQI